MKILTGLKKNFPDSHIITTMANVLDILLEHGVNILGQAPVSVGI